MSAISQIKDELLIGIWLPLSIEGGRTLFPRLKTNKKMKTLTLTSTSNCRELEELIKNKLTKKEYITGWNKGNTEAWRLECEKLEFVNPGCFGQVYEDAIQSPDSLQDIFPFDILNLDFSSQSPEVEVGRIEKEIIGLEHTVRLQRDRGSKGMVLIYTTIVNSERLNPPTIKQNSDMILIDGWPGLSLNGQPSTVIDQSEKINFLKDVFEQITSKYHFRVDGSIKSCCKPIPSENKQVFSIGVVLTRS